MLTPLVPLYHRPSSDISVRIIGLKRIEKPLMNECTLNSSHNEGKNALFAAKLSK